MRSLFPSGRLGPALAFASLGLLAIPSPGCGGSPKQAEGADPGAEGPGAPDMAAPDAGDPAAPEAEAAAPAEAAGEEAAAAEPAEPAPQSVELMFVETKTKKGAPPTLLFDVTVRNARGVPRWLILPSIIHPSEGLMKGGVTGVDILRAKGEGKATIGRFKGPGAFQAVLVPAEGEVKLGRVPIQCGFSTVKECVVPIEIYLAVDLKLGDQSAADLLGKDAEAEASASVNVEEARQVASKPVKAKGAKPELTDPSKVKLRFLISE